MSDFKDTQIGLEQLKTQLGILEKQEILSNWDQPAKSSYEFTM